VAGKEIEAIDPFNARLASGDHLNLTSGITEPNHANAGLGHPGPLFTAPQAFTAAFQIIQTENLEMARQHAATATLA
jgi:hypothetical protein